MYNLEVAWLVLALNGMLSPELLLILRSGSITPFTSLTIILFVNIDKCNDLQQRNVN